MKKLPLFLALALVLESVAPAAAQVRSIVPAGEAGVVGTVGSSLGTLTPNVGGASLIAPSFNTTLQPAALQTTLSAPFVPAAVNGVTPSALKSVSITAATPLTPVALQSVIPAAAKTVSASLPAVKKADALSALKAVLPAASQQSDEGGKIFDGSSELDDAVLKPAFETPTQAMPAPSYDEAAPDEGDNPPARPQLSFQPAQKSGLLSIEQGIGLWGTMKMVKDNPYSRDWWNQYKKGTEIDVVVRGENVFNSTTKITFAVTKPIGKLTREDFEGTVPKHMLQAGVVALRKYLINNLEENRRKWSPEAPPVGPETKVRVVKFQPYLELFREKNGKDAVPAVEKPAERTPLKIKPEGALAPLSYMLPRAVYVDMDMFDGAIPAALLGDMAKLQRTGVYFVAFTRKPYAAAGSMKEKLVKQLSAYQLSVLMPIRFMMVTDDGAVISELPKGGSPEAVDVLSFTTNELDVIRDAASKAAEQIGGSPRGLEEVRQPALVERVDRFGGDGKASEGPDPRVRYQVRLPKYMSGKSAAWLEQFEAGLSRQGLKFETKLETLADGRVQLTVSRTTLEKSMGRLGEALGEKFGLYMNPGDALVLSDDPKIMAANPKSIDVGGISGLKGAELVENALGLMLGEHRENREGDLAGSASRMASFSYNKQRYLSEKLIETDAEEQNINFFSGHVVHAANDWLVWNLQNGRVPTKEEFAAHLSRKWNEGMREFKAVGMPPAHLSDSWLKASLTRAESMYDTVVKTYQRKEILIGTEIPNFFMLKDYQRRSGELKRRYVLHTIFDFIALRPDPKRPGHATLVIYDFKTGPAKTSPKLNKDIQVLTYALFAHEKWVGRNFPAPYLAGTKGYMIDDVSVEFIYSQKVQPTTVNRWGLDAVRRRIISTLNRIHAAEAKLFGMEPAKKPAKKGAKTAPKKGDKTPAKKPSRSSK